MAANTPKKGYQYFDTPDGEDCLKKLGIMTKYGTLAGLALSSYDVLLYSHPKGLGPILGRYAYITLPIIGISAAFSAATCASTNIRKKDDKVNYVIGGVAAAAVWGAWRKSFKIGIYGGFFLGVFAAVIKDSYENNWLVIRPTGGPKMHTSPYWTQQDWSLIPDPGRTWKRSADE